MMFQVQQQLLPSPAGSSQTTNSSPRRPNSLAIVSSMLSPNNNNASSQTQRSTTRRRAAAAAFDDLLDSTTASSSINACCHTETPCRRARLSLDLRIGSSLTIRALQTPLAITDGFQNFQRQFPELCESSERLQQPSPSSAAHRHQQQQQQFESSSQLLSAAAEHVLVTLDNRGRGNCCSTSFHIPTTPFFSSSSTPNSSSSLAAADKQKRIVLLKAEQNCREEGGQKDDEGQQQHFSEMMSRESPAAEGGKSVLRRCIAFPPLLEPKMERENLLGSSSSSTSGSDCNFSRTTKTMSTSSFALSGSLSCANMASYNSSRTADQHNRFPMSNSCSSSAIDQLQSIEVTKIFDFLFLGSQKDALDMELLEKNGINRVINLSENCPRAECITDDQEHFMRIPVSDSYSAKLLPHFENAFQFIEQARKSGERVLVHCLAGISRSPTLAIAYVMRHNALSNDDAYKLVKNCRPTISPNFNFLGQLWEYEKQLREKQILPEQTSPTSADANESSPSSSIENLESARPPVDVDEPSPAQPRLLNANGKRPFLEADKHQLHNQQAKIEAKEEEQQTTMAKSAKPEKVEQEKGIEEKTTATAVPRPRQLLGKPSTAILSANERHSCPSSLMSMRRRILSNSPPIEIPSPSTEFSRLDISLANPCFGFEIQQKKKMTNTVELNIHQQQENINHAHVSPSCNKSTEMENPMFGIMNQVGSRRQTTSTAERRRMMHNSLESCSSSASQQSSSSADSGFGGSTAGWDEEFMGWSSQHRLINTRECLADTDGDQLVKLGSNYNYDNSDTLIKKNEEEPLQHLHALDEANASRRTEEIGVPTMKKAQQQIGDQQQRRKMPTLSARRQLLHCHSTNQMRQCFNMANDMFRCVASRCNSSAASNGNAASTSAATSAHQLLSVPKLQSSCTRGGTTFQHHFHSNKTLPSSSSSSLPSSSANQQAFNAGISSRRPKPNRTCCLDRLIMLGRRRNPAVINSQFRQSLPTIGDDRNREEEEEAKEKAERYQRSLVKKDSSSHLGEHGKSKEKTSPTPSISIGLLPIPDGGEHLDSGSSYRSDPDRASISSASSLEIAVQ